ncbi:putative disease resistance RPP13-like protein 1 [Solanum pennellii]|uniref:Disease resistance RPP13-like protein 1 n=1 Tax=Solanum pennellii TaxID=28526 RepID=A0ABM1FML7_SOLPN|nr:putative disease resistance RPP13-like protein 1 [Solanum pennellii]XP_027768884.1 putative disease resistance RPP13-like protein 1 [Solanum pennellii]
MEIGLAVGGAFLSSALNVLFDRLAPNGDLLNMLRKHTDDVELFEKLGDILLGLQIVLSDAENKKASNQFVSQWLHKLQTDVGAAENLIEQVNYEALRLKVETSNQQVSDLNLCLSDDFFLNIKKKLENTTKKLEVLEKQIGRLGLKEHFVLTKQETRTPSTSLVDDSAIFGRKNEIENLVGRLLSMDTKGKNLSVIPIVGMGGLGKTTLAKAVYNDKRVQKHFGLTAWFCVSEAYDAFRITKGLLQEIGSTDLNADDNLNQLQVKLKETLNGKRFLVVLDDVWNDNYPEWDDLRNLFLQGNIGSKIIVTTRKESVALMMGSEAIYMGILSSEDSWALFKRHSLEHKDPKEHPEFEEVGKQIADKCKGLPLALKALAGMLRSKSEVDEWRDILRSEIWELPSCSNGILPALMLSYNDLPAHLKQCFAYCAIYPKDYQFRKDQVIHLWIANGLVHQFHSGNQYFIELRSRSLFEMASEPSERDVEEFLMHDLVNDLAQIASSNLCIRLEDNKGSRMLEQCRHMSYSIGGDGEFEKLKSLFKSEQLRTLLPIGIQFHYSKLSKRVLLDILPTLRSLRVLSLSHYNIKELTNDLFIKLKLLRFLDLSCTWITKLPDSICGLYNLETLLLSSCGYLKELPRQMDKLINLRHLDISNTRRLKMPLHLSRLKSLQVLVGAKFLLGGWRTEYFGEAQNLYGSLSVVKLENVVDRREAVKAKMREKNHVDKLSLKWSESISADNSQTERDILDELRPHKNIKEAVISGYRGTNFPNWVADPSFVKLVNLSLRNCKNCYSLPALGQLPCLKFLSVKGMHGIRVVTEEFYGILSSKKPFNCLEKLEFEDMPEWKQWHTLGIGEFPTLENLLIKNCPELSLEMPIQFSSLKRFRVVGCPVVFDDAQLFRSQLEAMKQIEALYISGCNSVTSFPFSILPTTLKRIEISGCPTLKLEAPVDEMFVEYLSVYDCDCVDDISPEFLPTARHLIIWDCHNVTRFLIPSATETLTIQNCENVEKLSVACGGAAQMTSLNILECKKLKCLPERMQELLPSLKGLNLSDCPEIEGELPFNLQKLYIRNCKKLVNGRKEWNLQRLIELWIYHDGSDEDIEHWELPSSIQRLTIYNLKTLSRQHLKSLTSLQYLLVHLQPPKIQSHGQLSSFSHLTSLQTLQIRNLPLAESALPSSLSHLTISHFPNLQSLVESALPSSLSHLTISHFRNLQSLAESALPSSLSHLTISHCPNLQSIAESALPSSLSHLTISHCPNLQSIAESALPSSLSHLTISHCPNLQSIAESALPSSLSQLTISHCPNLQSLAESALPSSLSKLWISECPLLKPLLEFHKGGYWPQIAHIPTIKIDWECM